MEPYANRYDSMVFTNPSSHDTFGCQPKSSLAFEISGCRCEGSSEGKGLNVRPEVDFVSLSIFSANSSMVTSVGFPKFTGPISSPEWSMN